MTDRCTRYEVPIAPGGVLNDYVPFYFTARSVMMMNIVTGRGVKQRQREEIIILVSSMHQLQGKGLPFVFTSSFKPCSTTSFLVSSPVAFNACAIKSSSITMFERMIHQCVYYLYIYTY